MKRRAMIVDDEAPARKVLEEMLAGLEEPRVEVLASCGDGFAAVAGCLELHPDVMLLDIAMPKLDGFEVLELLAQGRPAAARAAGEADDSIALAAGGRKHWQQQTIASLEAELDPAEFVRIHRSQSGAAGAGGADRGGGQGPNHGGAGRGRGGRAAAAEPERAGAPAGAAGAVTHDESGG